MDISYIVNQRITRWSDEQWDEGVEMLKRVTPAQAADLLRGDYSVGLFLSVLRRNPGLLRTGARKFFDIAMQRLGRATPVTDAEVGASAYRQAACALSVLHQLFPARPVH